MKLPATTRGSVLFADDDAALRRPTALSLHRAGFAVTAVGSGDDALALLSSEPFDVLLADIAMPGNDQLQLAGQTTQGMFVPVVLLTGYPSVSTAVLALRYGVVDYVTKPADLDQLFLRLDAAIEKGRAVRAISQAREQASQLASTVKALESVLGVAPRSERTPVVRVQAPPGDPLSRLTAEELEILSPRERDVLRLLATGNLVADAAKTLGLSANTVRNHVKSVFVKLRVRSQVALLGKLAGHAGPTEIGE